MHINHMCLGLGTIPLPQSAAASASSALVQAIFMPTLALLVQVRALGPLCVWGGVGWGWSLELEAWRAASAVAEMLAHQSTTARACQTCKDSLLVCR